MSESVTITLPLPNPCLSPNARPHWRTKARATKAARLTSRFETLNTCEVGEPWAAADVECRFYFKTRAKRDKDNCQASCKAYFDGIADAGLVTNDSGLTHLPVVIDYDKLRPRLEMTITRTGSGKP